MDSFQSAWFHFAPDQSASISSEVALLLASTVGLTITDVKTDARDVANWHGPSDHDLLTSIETRRKLGPAAAVTYLRNLRTALATYSG